jgi:hypothetical protein
VLIKLNGHFLTDFLSLETVLDDSVGGTVSIEAERGGVTRALSLTVGDLHAATPARLLDAWGGVLHALSLQQARNYRAQAGLTYVADAGYVLGTAGVPRHAVIVSVAGAPTPHIDAAAAALAALAPGARVPLQYYTFGDRHRVKTALLTVNSCWYGPLTWYDRDDAAGYWRATPALPAAAAPAPVPPSPAAAATPKTARGGDDAGGDGRARAAKRARGCEDAGAGAALAAAPSAASGLVSNLFGFFSRAASAPSPAPAPASSSASAPDASDDPIAAALAPSLVQVGVDIPPIGLADGVLGRAFKGCGLVVAHGPAGGLVLTDRNTIPIAAVDVRLAFAAHPSDVPGRVVYLHPVHNFALVAYDGGVLCADAAAAVRAAALDVSPLRRGAEVCLVGLSSSLRPLSRRSRVTDAAHALAIPPAEVPRYRATNEEVIELDDDFGAAFSGVLADASGRVRALWASYSKQVAKDDDREFVRGLPADIFAPAVAAAAAALARAAEDASSGAPRHVALSPADERFLDAEFEPVHLTKAGGFGLSAAWVRALAAADPARRQALRVAGVPLGSPARGALREGDFLLRVNGAIVSSFRDVERAAAAALVAAGSGDDADDADVFVSVTVWRAGAEAALRVGLARACALGTRRLLHWAGAQLQATHRSVRELGFAPPADASSDDPSAPPPSGVFVSRWHHGSPAQRWGLYALHWITAVNGRPTPDLDAFADAVRGLRDDADVRLSTVALNTRPKVLTLKTDDHYWPPFWLECDAAGDWRRREL